MYKHTDKEFQFETEILKQGAYIDLPVTNPETAPIYLTTAYNVEDLDDLMTRYDEKGFCYNRFRNPNRSALNDLMSYLEKGEQSVSCSSGMAAISTAIMANLKAGDHLLSDKALYGETIELLEDILGKFDIETSFVDFTNLSDVEAAVKPNTRVFFTETISNPLITLPDMQGVADIAHKNDAVLVVDNTFMTGYGFRPLEFGADMVVNSLTKFASGHSDAVAGSITASADMIAKCHHIQVLVGSQADPFTAWLVQRGIRTLKLRMDKAYQNAEALAKTLKESPYVLDVFHPSLPDHPQHELAMKQFPKGAGGMLTFVMKDDREKVNAFMRKLNLAHYAMTLGGYRTTLSHPISSSHLGMPQEVLDTIGITNGMMRVSVGIEDTVDLVDDFLQALEVFK